MIRSLSWSSAGLLAALFVGFSGPRGASVAEAKTSRDIQLAQAVVINTASYFCWGSYRANGQAGPPYSHVQNQQFGGEVPKAGSWTMLTACKDRIKADSSWRANICAGLPGGNWTVHTNLHVSACATVTTSFPCGNTVGSTGFWAQCGNGQLTSIGP
jgi:hypothetical protein